MRTETRDVYISDDGQTFTTAEACQAHELKLVEQAKRLARLKVWIVRSGFDSTEGRGYHHTTYLVTDASLAEIFEYCLDRFGRPLDGWYGDGYFERWSLHQTDHTAARALELIKGSHTGIGLSAGAADLVFLSKEDIDHPGLPKRVFPWPKPKPAGTPTTPPPKPSKK